MDWFGNWQESMSPFTLWLVVVLASGACGATIGFERERKDKPAGLKTISLICMGAAIFTRLSFELADGRADVTRIAAQVIPGVGFLGAGAILRNRGAVIGLTTAASIWVSASLGMVIGGGLVALGLVLTLLVLGVHFLTGRIERWVIGPCRRAPLTVLYEPHAGRTLVRLRRLLDEERLGKDLQIDDSDPACARLVVPICTTHRHHRRVLGHLADMAAVLGLEGEGLEERRGR